MDERCCWRITVKTIYIFERGILGWQSIFGDWLNWPNQAIAWIHKNTPHKAQTLTYFTGFIFPALTRRRRARNFAKLLNTYNAEGWRIVLVAHSEGAATGLLAMELAGYPVIDELHLICGACNSDCYRNGINSAVIMNRLKKICVYVAGKDRAMRLEDTYIGSACFGLQCGGTPMGLKGPNNAVGQTKERLSIVHWPEYGHSDCWLTKNFNSTMRLIAGPSGAEPQKKVNGQFANALSFLQRP